MRGNRTFLSLSRTVTLRSSPKQFSTLCRFHQRSILGCVGCLPVSLRSCCVKSSELTRFELSPGLGSVVFGYELGVMAGVLAAEDFQVRARVFVQLGFLNSLSLPDLVGDYGTQIRQPRLERPNRQHIRCVQLNTDLPSFPLISMSLLSLGLVSEKQRCC